MNSRTVVQTGVRSYEFRSFDVTSIGPEEGLLRVEQSGICGSDWSQYKHGHPKTVIPGHEPMGIIEAIGDVASERWGARMGDRVAVETMLPCGYCGAWVGVARPVLEDGRISGVDPETLAFSLIGTIVTSASRVAESSTQRSLTSAAPRVRALFESLITPETA